MCAFLVIALIIVSLPGLKLFDKVPGKNNPFSSIKSLLVENPLSLKFFVIFLKDETNLISFTMSITLTGPETFITISPLIDLLYCVFKVKIFLFFIILTTLSFINLILFALSSLFLALTVSG